ncbi:MAG TPA: hypothetical protein DCE42_05265 [Myxococcales bacterium]|nr:hypothetical protein [Deltaproteobacteria bacterium]MBK07343.1 hypothetical protein [Deltaproteobacteria bacterium]MBU53239.1 hypothetical protein [Deltaproteobacteria bacterium]HAA54141.1 hypothetical protein [Myxococcales bacterium]
MVFSFSHEGALEALLQDAFEEELGHLIRTPGNLYDPTLFKDNKLPANVLEFIDDPYLSGDPVNLDKEVRNVLWDIWDPEIREVDIEVGKGSGKSEICILSQLYGGYFLSRMKDPHRFFGLGKHSIISSINVSINEKQAKRVIFKGIQDKIESSPYFQSLKPVVLTEEIRLPGNISLFCGHSGSKAFLGYATIWAVMDETNYMVQTSTRSGAEELYGMLSGSMKTRAPNHYKLISVSSVTLGSTWLHQRIEEAKRQGDIYARRIPVEIDIISENSDGSVILEVSSKDPCTKEEVKRAVLEQHQVQVDMVSLWDELGDRQVCMVVGKREMILGI